MKTMDKIVIVIVLLAPASRAQACNNTFTCSDPTTFQLCSAVGHAFPCEGGTFCSPDCATPCTATPGCAPHCNDHGFYCTGPKTALRCVDDGPPSGEAIVCPDPLVCCMDSAIDCVLRDCHNNSNSTAQFACVDDGFYPDPDNANNFHLCSFLSTGGLQAHLYSCPQGFTFDADDVCSIAATSAETTTTIKTATGSPSCGAFHFHCVTPTEFSVCVDGGAPEGLWACPPATLCHPDNQHPCSETVPTTTATTPTPFACEDAGTFPDPDSCSRYYLCASKETGGFHQASYSCPDGAVFSPETGRCSRNATACSLTTPGTALLTTTPPPTPGTTLHTTTPPPFKCAQQGRFPDPLSCDHYYECTRVWFSSRLRQSHRRCYGGRVFDVVTRRCARPNVATCSVP